MPETTRAFVSCSLRTEDADFVKTVESILKTNTITPYGTVGRHDASPENPVALMKENIEKSDIVVVCATKRYIQSDAHRNIQSTGISEMLQFETGIAHANGKPIIVFVEEGVNVGNAIPNITQYITIKHSSGKYMYQKKIVQKLIEKARKQSQENKDWDTAKGIGKVVVAGLALFGLKSAFSRKK